MICVGWGIGTCQDSFQEDLLDLRYTNGVLSRGSMPRTLNKFLTCAPSDRGEIERKSSWGADLNRKKEYKASHPRALLGELLRAMCSFSFDYLTCMHRNKRY